MHDMYRIRHSLSPTFGLTDMSSDVALRSTERNSSKRSVKNDAKLLVDSVSYDDVFKNSEATESDEKR